MYFVVVELNWKTKIKNLTGLLQKLNCKIITFTGFDIKKIQIRFLLTFTNISRL